MPPNFNVLAVLLGLNFSLSLLIMLLLLGANLFVVMARKLISKNVTMVILLMEMDALHNV